MTDIDIDLPEIRTKMIHALQHNTAMHDIKRTPIDVSSVSKKAKQSSTLSQRKNP